MVTHAVSHRRRWGLRILTGLVALTLVVVTAAVTVFFLGPATLGVSTPVVKPRSEADVEVLPDITGSDYSHHEVAIEHPAVILVGAHWCHYCQKEMAQLNDLEPSELPPGNLYFVSTWHMWPFAWPPAERLHLEGFPGQVVVDMSSLVSREIGVQAVPAWVFTDTEGRVRPGYLAMQRPTSRS